MSKKPNSVSNIFQSCILDRKLKKDNNYNESYYSTDLISITNSELFEAGLDDFLDSPEGAFISKDFLKTLILRTLVSHDEYCDSDVSVRAQWFKDRLKMLGKERDFKVVKKIFGGKVTSSELPVKLGSLTIYEVPRHGEHIQLPFDSNHFRKDQHTKTVAEYCAKAKDDAKALELADIKFNAFDLSVAFLLGERNIDFSIGILRMRFSPVQQPIVFTEGGLFGKEEKNHNFKPDFDLTELANLCPDRKNTTLMSFFDVALSPCTEIERKISRAIEWVGEAYLDNNRSSALLKVVVALEALFKVDEASVITASIMASMSEQCAYINGQSTEECMKIESYVKKLYGVRSSVVHSGSISVKHAELKKALEFARSTIFNLLLMKLELRIAKMKELQELIRASRYKASPLWRHSSD